MFDPIPLLLAQAAPQAGGADANGLTASPAPAATGAPGAEGAPTAVEGQNGGPATGQPATPAQPASSNSFFIFLAIMVVFLVMMVLPQRREKKRRASMLSGLKKGDRILTVGGIIGTVMDVRPNDVLVKVDENSNTRIRFSRSAINSILPNGEE
jgi:preprotein translocase subunit YajC